MWPPWYGNLGVGDEGPDQVHQEPEQVRDDDPVATSIAISALPVIRLGNRPAPIPIHAEHIIWNGSHGPTPAVSKAEANNDVQPST